MCIKQATIKKISQINRETHMKNISRRTALSTTAAFGLTSLSLTDQARAKPSTKSLPKPNDLTLWYNKPAIQWVEALAIGNGRMGAMVFGGVKQDRFQLNDDTLYAGGPYDPNNPEALENLLKVRNLINEGKFSEAQKLTQEKLMSKPLAMPSYQTIGSLMLTFDHVSAEQDYRRMLDLTTAVTTTTYTIDGVTFKREAFLSPIDQVLVIRLSASKPKALSLELGFTTPMTAVTRIDDALNMHLMVKNSGHAHIKSALTSITRVKLIPKSGTLDQTKSSLKVKNADELLILVATNTNYKTYKDVSNDPYALSLATLEAAAKKSYSSLKSKHIAEHKRLFDRVSVDFGRTAQADLPTDERIKLSQTNPDPALAALYYQFGRYLLISCSRPGTQPANLQGLWNDLTQAPWGSKYTININTQMNYWPAESNQLAECVEPLIAMVKEIAVTGAKTAKVHYNARGWVCHHNTDLWRATAAIDGAFWGMWPTGGAWLSLHLWDRYDYGRDLNYLKEIYPILHGASLFFVDSLVEDPKSGYLVTSPSISPENAHPFGSSICAGPTMDMQIIRDLFDVTMKAASLLKTDEAFVAEVKKTRERLVPNQIGAQGQLMEWKDDWDAKAPEQHHRHVSHLYGVYPSDQITIHHTKALAEAAKVSLNTRGDISTGWAIAWRLNLWARLGEGDRAHRILGHLLGPQRTYPNLFDAHPPFQIDGNFGGTSGMCEMIMQSYRDEIYLLPALPKAWPTGKITGLVARGGFVMDIFWQEGKLKKLKLTSKFGTKTVLNTPSSRLDIALKAGETQVLSF